MAAKLASLTHKIAMQLYLVAESCNICSTPSRWPVHKLLDTPSYTGQLLEIYYFVRYILVVTPVTLHQVKVKFSLCLTKYHTIKCIGEWRQSSTH